MIAGHGNDMLVIVEMKVGGCTFSIGDANVVVVVTVFQMRHIVYLPCFRKRASQENPGNLSR